MHGTIKPKFITAFTRARHLPLSLADNIKIDHTEDDRELLKGFIWLRAATSGGLFWIRRCTFGFHKMWGVYCVAEKLLAFQQGLCTTDFRFYRPSIPVPLHKQKTNTLGIYIDPYRPGNSRRRQLEETWLCNILSRGFLEHSVNNSPPSSNVFVLSCHLLG